MRYSIFLLGLLFLSGITLSHFACGGSPTSPAPTPTPVPANTSTPTCGNATGTCTATLSFTFTATFTPTHTPTNSFTPTKTYTPTNSFTPTPTHTPTSTNTPCGYPGNTCTLTFTLTWTSTGSATPTYTYTPFPTATITPTTGPTPGVDLTFSFFYSLYPQVACVTNSLNSPTYTAVQTAPSGFYPTFNFNIPTANSPVYVELITQYEGAPYPASGYIIPHVGDPYGFFQAPVTSGGAVSFVCLSTAEGWGQGNVAVTTGTTSNIGSSMSFSRSCTQTGYGGYVTLGTGQTVDAGHRLYLGAYPDNTFNRGGGASVTNTGKSYLLSSSSVNGAWQDLPDTTFSGAVSYWVQAWYDAGGQGSTGCAYGEPCPHQGDPIYQYVFGGYNYAGYFWTAEVNAIGITITGNTTYSCSALGALTAGTSIISPNSGGLLFEYMNVYGGAPINQLSFYSPGGTGHFEAGIYECNGYGVPGALSADTGYQAVTGTGLNTANLNTPVTTVANGQYFIGVFSDNTLAVGPNTLLAPNSQLGVYFSIDDIVSGWTPSGTTLGTDYLPGWNTSGVPTFPGSSTPGLQFFFASVGVPCN